jgi:hypothetical protein
MRFEQGDRVRIHIPDETDPDFEYHWVQGEIVEVVEDDADKYTRDSDDRFIYRVEFDTGQQKDFRWRSLRPISESC